MTIAIVAGAGGSSFDNTTSGTFVFASVTAGSLIIIFCNRYSPGSQAFVSSDCTKSAGAATIGSVVLDSSVQIVYGAGADTVACGIWSVIVSGTGSLTMQVGNMQTGSYFDVDGAEFTGSFDSSRLESSNNGSSATDDSTAPSTNNGVSAGAALFVAGLSVPDSPSMSISPDGAFTTIFEQEDGNNHSPGSSIYQIVSGGTTDAGDWALTGNNGGYACALAVYKEAGQAPLPKAPPSIRFRSYRPRPFAPGNPR